MNGLTSRKISSFRPKVEARMTLRMAIVVVVLFLSAAADDEKANMETLHPTASSTQVKVAQPACKEGEQALHLARFCSSTTSIADSLPRISFKVNPVAPSKVAERYAVIRVIEHLNIRYHTRTQMHTSECGTRHAFSCTCATYVHIYKHTR
jgi:hypothetical protein